MNDFSLKDLEQLTEIIHAYLKQNRPLVITYGHFPISYKFKKRFNMLLNQVLTECKNSRLNSLIDTTFHLKGISNQSQYFFSIAKDQSKNSPNLLIAEGNSGNWDHQNLANWIIPHGFEAAIYLDFKISIPRLLTYPAYPINRIHLAQSPEVGTTEYIISCTPYRTPSQRNTFKFNGPDQSDPNLFKSCEPFLKKEVTP